MQFFFKALLVHNDSLRITQNPQKSKILALTRFLKNLSFFLYLKKHSHSIYRRPFSRFSKIVVNSGLGPSTKNKDEWKVLELSCEDVEGNPQRYKLQKNKATTAAVHCSERIEQSMGMKRSIESMKPIFCQRYIFGKLHRKLHFRPENYIFGRSDDSSGVQAEVREKPVTIPGFDLI
jgi:hypothetical protein